MQASPCLLCFEVFHYGEGLPLLSIFFSVFAIDNSRRKAPRAYEGRSPRNPLRMIIGDECFGSHIRGEFLHKVHPVAKRIFRRLVVSPTQCSLSDAPQLHLFTSCCLTEGRKHRSEPKWTQETKTEDGAPGISRSPGVAASLWRLQREGEVLNVDGHEGWGGGEVGGVLCQSTHSTLHC